MKIKFSYILKKRKIAEWDVMYLDYKKLKKILKPLKKYS
jgi:SPX domain protein involved in polyphosphate accumulation